MVDGDSDGRSVALGETAQLLRRVRDGDDNAVKDLIQMYQPLLQRWATGRIPGYARGLVDTADVVQECLVQVLARVDHFDASRPGGFLAYLRRSLLNQIRSEIRAARSRPRSAGNVEERDDLIALTIPGMTGETIDAYEVALADLQEDDQAAVILRVEFGLRYKDIAEALGRPSADAARMQVGRALARLAATME